ncbi:hypothetical protein AALD01_04530 [Oscillospiraceae bacterium 21-37]
MSEVDIRIEQFRSIMEPALHLFPSYLVEDLKTNGFFTAPASTKYHGAFEGGLFEHGRNVTQTLITITEKNWLVWQRAESPYIVGMFHDLCKIDLYRHPMSDIVLHTWDESGQENIHEVDRTKWEHNPEALLKGHGDKSVMLLSQYLQLTMEEILCIRYHMGAFVDREEWADYTRAIRLYDTVLWTHHADMIASHLVER